MLGEESYSASHGFSSSLSVEPNGGLVRMTSNRRGPNLAWFVERPDSGRSALSQITFEWPSSWMIMFIFATRQISSLISMP